MQGRVKVNVNVRMLFVTTPDAKFIGMHHPQRTRAR